MLRLSLWFIFIITKAGICLPPGESQTATLMFVGDTSTDGPNRYFARERKTIYNDAFTYVSPIIHQADLAIANLEGAVGTEDIRNNPFKVNRKGPYLLGTTESLQSFREAGFDLVSLANNHLNDYGAAAVKWTRKTLEKAHLEYFGVNYGRDPYKNQIPVIKDVKGIRLGFLGYEHITRQKDYLVPDEEIRRNFNEGMALFSERTLQQDVANLRKKKVDVIIVLMHWGRADSSEILDSQKELAAVLRKNGVDVVVGCHSHRLHAHSFHNNSLIAYSLGDFMMGPVNTTYWKFFARARYDFKYSINKDKVKEFIRSAKNIQDFHLSRILKIEITKYGVQYVLVYFLYPQMRE
ncbi:uncharacterized protein LOC114518759 [Dendronephthya gigantea]|uniref:uncharacterized protein LOC114518759 n=1 Tax=Dendronephthya gigantea TaxID=151771 RepID=UPI00106ADA73|nr:uncharacterized protein LOC114518759 [Dendronephthya gigantea]